MKKLGLASLLILIVVAVVMNRRPQPAALLNTDSSSQATEAEVSQALSAPAEVNVKPALAQLRALVSEDRSESSAEQASFENRLEDLMAEMPTLTTQAKPATDADGDIHGSLPEELIEARVLGQLRKATFENPQHAARSQVVYAGCAERADLSNAVRAVCFMRALELSIKVKNPQTIAALEVPVQIRSLAQKLISKGKL